MGLRKFIKDTANSAKSGLANVGNILTGTAGQMINDAFIEYFECRGLSNEVLAVPATKVSRQVSNKVGAANTKGTENLISNGSVFDVAINQCAILIENGKVHDCIICTDPELAGQYQYVSNLEPSWIVPSNPSVGLETKSSGKLREMLGDAFENYKKRLVAGGQSTNTMRLFYINLKPMRGIKIGAGNINIRDRNIGQTIHMGVNGTMILQITDPVFFYENLMYNPEVPFSFNTTDGAATLKSIKALLVNNISAIVNNVVKSSNTTDWFEFSNHQNEISDAVVAEVGSKLFEGYGMCVSEVALQALIDPDQMKELDEFDRLHRTGSDQATMAAKMLEAQTQAMTTAAGNSNGAMMGFMGMNMAMNASGQGGMQNYINNMPQQHPVQQQAMSPQQVTPQAQVQNVPQTNNTQAPKSETWVCPSCGIENSMNFCMSCGEKKPEPKPEPDDSWICPDCGTANKMAFCMNCGHKKPEPVDDGSWTCPDCGTANKMLFCMNCGHKKPEVKKEIICSCGFKPEDQSNPPKFCPMCGSKLSE